MKKLTLSFCEGDPLLKCFEDINIEKIKFKITPINESSLKSLEKIQNSVLKLEESSLNFNKKLKYNIQAKKLILKSNSQLNSHLEFINFFPNLENLHFDWYKLDFKELYDNLSGIKLKKFSYGNEVIEVENYEYLQEILIDLKDSFSFESVPSSEIPFFSYLKNNRTLKSLKCSEGFEIYDLDVFLTNNQSLTKLKIMSNRNDGELLDILCKGLQKNYSLKKLKTNINLESNYKIFHQYLLNNTSLTELDITNSLIKDDDIVSLGEYFSNNSSIRKFNISDNFIDDSSIKPNSLMSFV